MIEPEEILRKFLADEGLACLEMFKAEGKYRQLTEDFIKGRLIQHIARDEPKLYLYQDFRVRYYKENEPDQYVDLVISDKALPYKKTLEEIWDDKKYDMVVCEIKLSSTTQTTPIIKDQERLKKWGKAYPKIKFRFLYLELGTKGKTPKIYLWDPSRDQVWDENKCREQQDKGKEINVL